MPMKILLGLLALSLASCQGADAVNNGAATDPNACPAVLDSNSARIATALQNCQALFTVNLTHLQQIKLTTSGFVNGSTWYRFDSTGHPLGAPASTEHPLLSLYRMWIAELCSGDTIPSGASICLHVESAEFDPTTGLPLRLMVQVKTRPGVDADAITGWETDSALWRTRQVAP